jgi:hypothetical protein
LLNLFIYGCRRDFRGDAPVPARAAWRRIWTFQGGIMTQAAGDEMGSDAGAPNAGNQERDPRQDAGQDASIAQRLAENPDDIEARLDNALDETMDASDPPEMTQPGRGSEPAPSSGYNEEEEPS